MQASAFAFLKWINFSEKMATPNKPTMTGKDPRALPDLTVLTGNRPDGTIVPTRPRHSTKVLDESLNQTISNTPEKDQLQNSSTTSIELMKSTVGWDGDRESWAEQVARAEMGDSSLLDSDTEGEREGEPEKKKDIEIEKEKAQNRLKKRPAKKSGEEPSQKKKNDGMSWADAAKYRICLITSCDLNVELVHEDYAHIQEKLVPVWLEDPASMRLSTVMKGGMRNGGIQLALETEEGVNWYRGIVPSIEPRTAGGPGYRFFGPGQKPYYNYRATTVEVKYSVHPDKVKKLILGFNPTLEGGFLAVSVIHSSKDRVVHQDKGEKQHHRLLSWHNGPPPALWGRQGRGADGTGGGGGLTGIAEKSQ